MEALKENLQKIQLEYVEMCIWKLKDIDIHNWPLKAFNEDYELASHITNIVNVSVTRIDER